MTPLEKASPRRHENVQFHSLRTIRAYAAEKPLDSRRYRGVSLPLPAPLTHMKPWQTIERALSPAGAELVLARRGEEWVVRLGGQVLMSSRVHGSEETLVQYALERVARPRRVVIGGLGLGFTLRAALRLVPSDVHIQVVELIPELVTWNRTHLADLAGRPLEDARVLVRDGDVYDVIVKQAPPGLDLLVLDIDNGPSAMMQEANGRLYSEAGARKCANALAPGGVLALWSAAPDERYRRNLEAAGLTVEMKSVSARPGSGAKDVLFLATKGGGAAQRGEGVRRSGERRSR